ncbi:MAG TPA: glycosyl hydrolase 115 family protein [Arachidicoccus sp.]|nr:glycosyl hydrolase 115 family protein [Arachidicoccus sp.]
MTHQRTVLIVIFLLFVYGGYSQLSIVQKANGNGNIFDFSNCSILSDEKDPVSVRTAARLFAGDVEKVLGNTPAINTHFSMRSTSNLIIAGTIENNRWIKELADKGKINVDSLKGAWERYGIFLIKNPYPNVKKALVIAGSGRRAVAYGLFKLSQTMGVSPWYWWADVPVVRRKSVFMEVQDFVSVKPAVKFRGVFINDEDWGLRPWAKNTFDPQLKNIGPKTYAKVFELLLRLDANYLCPAMHEASSAFNKYPENKVLADSFGIVMGSTHPEPLLFNNASEWDKKTMGEWNYMTNKKNILKVLDKRVKENSPYENVYTLALRGLHDREMTGNYTLAQRVKLVEEALNDQRSLLKKYIDKPLSEVPQIFVPYKEVLEIYNAGLKLPDDVTIVWPDDNYGYLKQLSNPTEQKRSGHSGVYYHASYLGSPHDYLWLGSTPPNLMYEELSKAYATGADRLWVLNAGDIKSCEAQVTQFLSMAYNMNDFSFQSAPIFQAGWLSRIYGQQYYRKLIDITIAYNQLAFSRKPEAMGWGYEWNSNKNARERTTDPEFSFENYHEAANRINEYLKIEKEVIGIWNELPENYKPSFFELLVYPVKGAGLMNRMRLTAQLQRQYLFEKRSAVNGLKRQVDELYDSLHTITKIYNTLLDGKWNKVVSLTQGVTASYFEKPKLDSATIPENGSLQIKAEGSSGGHNVLPTFNKLFKDHHYIEVYNTGQEPLHWTAKRSAPWIILDKEAGLLKTQDSLHIGVDWSKIGKDAGTKTEGLITITSGKLSKQVLVNAFNPDLGADSMKGRFTVHNGVISIPGIKFQRKVETKDIKMQVIDALGYAGKSVQIGSPVAPIQNPKSSTAANLQYDFYSQGRGVVHVYTYVLPVFPLSSNRDFGFHESSNSQTTYGVSIDDGAIAFPSSSAPEYSQAWSEHAIRNAAINESVLYIDKPGKHTLKIICGDPGMVIEKIVIDFGGMKFSYLGPPSTEVK